MRFGVFAVLALSAAFTAESQDNAAPRRARSAFSPEQLLINMPMNSDRRCFGIALAGAALLEGETISDEQCDVPDDLGKQIFDAAFANKTVRFRRLLCLGSSRVAIGSREGLEALTTAVADQYKQRHEELIASAEGRNKLFEAENKVLQTRRDLDAIMEGDGDHIVPLFLVGVRRFPDGEIKDTNHVVLITNGADGEKVVYDPNDPGTPISCKIEASRRGLLISWTCRYKDTGLVTSQAYRILETDWFLREALARK
jgi:hypothetical protein